MAITLHSTSRGGALSSANMYVTVPAEAPVGAVMVLGVAVHGRNDVSTQHSFGVAEGGTLANGWKLYKLQDNWAEGDTTDYFQLWAFAKVKAEGDETFTFTSSGQTNCARAWVLTAWTGCAAIPTPVNSAFSTSNTTSHRFAGLTMASAGDVFLGFTSRTRAQMSAYPALTFASENTKAGSGEADPAPVSAWYKVVTASGATLDIGYTASPSSDYASVSLALVSASGPQTVGDGDGVGMGRIRIPGFAGLPRLRHSVDPEVSAFNSAMLDERNVPILLATLEPLDSDAPSGATVEEKFSSGWYSPDYVPAIEKWPEVTRSLYGESKIGGRVGFTAGSLELLNDRESVPGDKYGVRVIGSAVLEGSVVVGLHQGGFEAAGSGRLDGSVQLVVPVDLEESEGSGELDGEVGEAFAVGIYEAGRLYFTGAPGWSSYDPDNVPIQASWPTGGSGSGGRGQMIHHRAGFSSIGGGGSGSPANGSYRIASRYVSAPMVAQSITGHVKAYMRARENSSTNNIDQAWVAIHVISEDCQTLRHTILDLGQYDGSNHEFYSFSPGKNRIVIQSGTLLTSYYDCELGDRLLVELGVGISGTGSSPSGGFTAGTQGSGTADLPEDETDTTATKRSWIEFDNPIVFIDEELYPVLNRQLSTSGNSGSNVTQNTITLPTHVSGDRLIVFFANDGTSNVSQGAGATFTKIFDQQSDGLACRGSIWYRDATASSTTLRLDTSASQGAAWACQIIPAGTFDSSQAPEVTTHSVGTSTTPTVGSHTLSWARRAVENMWFDFMFWDGNVDTAGSVGVEPWGGDDLTERWANSDGVGVYMDWGGYLYWDSPPQNQTALASSTSWGRVMVGIKPVGS